MYGQKFPPRFEFKFWHSKNNEDGVYCNKGEKRTDWISKKMGFYKIGFKRIWIRNFTHNRKHITNEKWHSKTLS